MKKALAILLTAVMLLGVLTACGSKKDDAADDTQNTEDADKAAADNVAALIDAIYVQERTDETDAQCEAAKAAWDALTDEQKSMVEGEEASPEYFGLDTGDASKDDPRNQDEIGENELLVVSFGTSYNDSRINDIKSIEDALQEAYPDWSVRRAFTAQIIINHIQARDGVLRLEKLHGRAVQDAVGERAHAAERFLAAREDLLVRDEAALHLLAQGEHGVRPLLRQAGIHDQRPDEDALQLRQLRRVVDRPDAVGIRVGGADRGGVVIRQKQAHAVHGLVREREGRGIFDAAALDAGVHDAARVRRQRQLAKRLRHEQQHDHHNGRDVSAQVFHHPHGTSPFRSS